MQLILSRSMPWRRVLLVWALVLALCAGMVSPAPADTAGQVSTRNIILGGIALAAGIILYNNYEHKVVQANTVVGTTSDGGVIYGDGRIVYPNTGYHVIYLSNNGKTACTFIHGNGVYCQPARLWGYFPHGYTPPCWPPGHCKQYWKQHPGNQGNEDEGNHGHGKGNGNRN